MVAYSSAPEIAVTGLAWMTALGDDLENVWSRTLAGETGFVNIPCTYPLRNQLAAPVALVDPEIHPAERLRRMTYRTARRAMMDASLSPTDSRLQLIMGTSFGDFLERDDNACPSLHTWAQDVAQELGVTNSPISVSTACSSGSDAILLGAELIRAGVADLCVCGGIDILTLSKRLAHSNLGTMSSTLLRAFDQRHDGTLLGEGAAFLVLEAGSRASERAASVYGFLRGIGSANDAATMTGPDLTGAGARLAIQRALIDAGLEPEDVDLVNAHASGTPLNDTVERDTLKAVFDNTAGPLVFATKGNFGHTLGATGAIEAIALILALRKQLIPPIVHLEEPDPEFPFPLPLHAAVRCDARIGLSLTLGFGGFNTCLLFEVDR